MRVRTLVVLALLGSCAAAQEPDTTTAPVDSAPGFNPFVTLASDLFEHNYFNAYAFGDGVLDSNNPIVTNTGQVKNTLGTGFDVGGGLSLFHTFHDAQLAISYVGDYRDYQSGYYTSGTTQNLSLGYTKRLTRHLSLSVGVSGGIFLYGADFLTPETETTPVVTNPFSPETRYFGAHLGVLYQQTRRLSYSVYGSFGLNRYNFAGAIGTTGGSGGASVNYRLTERDTLSGVYSYSYFRYQSNDGNDSVNQIGLSYSHRFTNRWYFSLFGGVAQNHAIGIIEVPVTVAVGNELVSGYVLGKYNESLYIPSFSGTVSHSYRRSLFRFSAGEGIAGAGNGYFLASRNIYAGGGYSYRTRNQSFSLGGNIYRLTSIANTIRGSYEGASIGATYDRSLFRHVGAFLNYAYNHYGSISPYSGLSDNRIAFGFRFSTQSVPITFF